MARQRIETVSGGIDTGKAQLDVFTHETKQFVSFANETRDIHRLVLLLELFPVERIVEPAIRRPINENAQHLRDFFVRRRQLLQTSTMEKNRLQISALVGVAPFQSGERQDARPA